MDASITIYYGEKRYARIRITGEGSLSDARTLKGVRMNHRSDIQELVDNWIWWVKSRRFYAPPIPANMLAMMQVDRRPSKEPPNARNDSLCSAFNMVIAISDTKDRLPFLYVYLPKYRPQSIKSLANELDITRETIYQKAHKSAELFYNQALRLMEMQAVKPVRIKESYDD